MDEKIRILCVSASPVPDGHTEQLLGIFASKAFSLGAEVEPIRLVDNPPPTVSGKQEQWKPDPFWADKITGVDAIVVATPTYWFNAPGILKDWIDNLTPLTYESKLDGLLGGVIVYGPEGGSFNVAQYLGTVFNNIGITVPARGLIWQEGPRRTGPNAWVESGIAHLAENIISLETALRSVTEENGNAYLASKVRRYRARSGKKGAGLGAFIEPQPETDGSEHHREEENPT
jgi:multimeric flavodoxin WrbA